jgi:hypothetical protein
MSHSTHVGFNAPLFCSRLETSSGKRTPREDASARALTVAGLNCPFQSVAAGVGHKLCAAIRLSEGLPVLGRPAFDPLLLEPYASPVGVGNKPDTIPLVRGAEGGRR